MTSLGVHIEFGAVDFKKDSGLRDHAGVNQQCLVLLFDRVAPGGGGGDIDRRSSDDDREVRAGQKDDRFDETDPRRRSDRRPSNTR